MAGVRRAFNSPARIRRSISTGESSVVADLFGMGLGIFVTDVHDPKLERHFALIGKIPILWSEVEFGISQVIAAFNGDSYHSKEQLWVVLARLGNRDRPDVLEAMNDMASLGPQVDACVAFAVKGYRILNQNRNALLHSHAVDFDDANAPVWTRFSGSKRDRTVHTLVPLKELAFQVRSYELMRNYLLQLYAAVWARSNPDCSRARLPRKFRPPRPLLAIPPNDGTPASDPRKKAPPRKPAA